MVLSYFDVLASYDMPPRFPLFLIGPFFSFCIYFVVRYKNNLFIQSIPLHWTAFYQSFRVPVELLLLYTFYKGIVPIEATFEGHNFDIVMGVLALLVGILILKTGRQYKLFLKVWNVVGIAMVLIVAITIVTCIYQPHIWGYSEPAVSCLL